MNTNIMQKIEGTLLTVFETFTPQQLLLINANIEKSQQQLNNSVQQILLFMQQKEIGYESFLSERCQPIIDFYLAPVTIQQQLFLSQSKLYEFFTSIPVVEAHVLNDKIKNAQQVARLNKQQQAISEQASILKFSHYRKPLTNIDIEKIAQLKQFLSLSNDEGYMDYLYQLDQGDLTIVAEHQNYQKQMLLYSELSPLQQLAAQRLFKKGQSKRAITA